MPRIPIYEQQVIPNASPGNVRVSAGDATGRGLQALSQGMDKLAAGIDRGAEVDFQLQQQDLQMQRQNIETDAKLWFAKSSSQFDLDQAEFLRQSQEKATPGADKFTPTYLEGFDKTAEGALNNAPSQYARQLMAAHLARSREAYGRAAMVFEAGERARFKGQQIGEGSDMSAKLIYGNPAAFEDEIGKWAKIIRDLPVAPEASAKLSEEVRKKLAWSAVTAEIDRSPKVYAPQRAVAPVAVNPDALTAAGVSEADTTRLSQFKFTPKQDEVLQSVSAGDAQKAAFLRTVLMVENRGFGGVRNDAKSASGSLGPFQFIESTGRAYGLMSEADRKVFGKSAQAAARFYDDLSRQYGGNVEAMIAHYNGGTAAGKAVLDGKEPPAKETRDYLAMARGLMAKGAEVPESIPESAPRGPAWKLLTFEEQQRAAEYARRKAEEVRQGAAVGLRYETQNVEAMARTGVAPTGPERSREEFMAAFRDPLVADNEYTRYVTARKTATAVASMQSRPSSELIAAMQRRPDANDPNFAVTAGNLAIEARAAADIVQARQSDPVFYAIQTGDFKLRPLDPQKPAEFSEELKRRTAALPGMAEKYGAAQMLSKPEAQVMAQNLELLPADRKVEQLESIRRSVGDDAVYGSLLNSLRPDSPVTALVGNIAAAGAKDAARLIAMGEDLLNPTKGGRKTDGTGAKFPMPQETLMRQSWIDGVGDAYRGYPDAESTAYQAFKAYYAAVAAQRGLNDPKASPDDRIVADALKASTGGVMRWKTDWFGNSTPSANIILPYGMPADQFRDRVSAEWLRMRAGLGYSKTDVGDIGLYNTGANGEYMVMSGKSWLPDKDGKPVMLRISESTPSGAGRVSGQITQSSSFGNRQDGTQKGDGFFGVLKRPDGNVSTELSIQFDDVLGGREIPLLVPTLTKKEIDTLLSLKGNKRAPKSIIDKAIAHAEGRVKKGKSPFAEPGERVQVPR